MSQLQEPWRGEAMESSSGQASIRTWSRNKDESPKPLDTCKERPLDPPLTALNSRGAVKFDSSPREPRTASHVERSH